MRILVSADAEDDLIDGARFYNTIEPGLGDRFIDSHTLSTTCWRTIS